MASFNTSRLKVLLGDLLVVVMACLIIFGPGVEEKDNKSSRLVSTTGVAPAHSFVARNWPDQSGLSAKAPDSPHFSPDTLIVRFRSDARRSAIDQLLRTLDATVVDRLTIVGLYSIRLPATITPSLAMSYLQSSNLVADVEQDQYAYALRLPNDPDLSKQWSLHTPQSIVLDDADIDAAEAWDEHTGSKRVAVMVIDTGIDTDHPDLAPNLWVNRSEVAGNNRDDDGNGYVDDVNGLDAISFAPPFSVEDDNGHGTHVSGIIAAAGNNGEGIVGVTWAAEIVTCKFLDSQGVGSLFSAIRCFEYGIKLRRGGLNLVATNNSWGNRGGGSPILADVIRMATAAGITTVAAAGNSAEDVDIQPVYPAAFDDPGIIAVAAHDQTGALAYFSSFGAARVDLSAPGVSVYSTYPDGRYASASGTSMAAPHVTGALALISSARPELSAAEVRAFLLANVTPDVRHAGKTASSGRLHLRLPLVDVDGDLMADGWEREFGLSPDNAADAAVDSDADGLTNLEEYRRRTNPRDADTDDDGLTDGFEVADGRVNPLDADSDDDGLADGEEINQTLTDPNRADTDGDGLKDGDERPANANPLDADSDDDGLSDGWEIGAGLRPDNASDAGSDADGDGLLAREEQAAGTDARKSDTDGDGLNDRVELQVYRTNPLAFDTEGDELPDGWEIQYGFNPLVNDRDGDADADGVSNYAEYRAGTDPRNAGAAPIGSGFSQLQGDPGHSGFKAVESRRAPMDTRWDIERTSGPFTAAVLADGLLPVSRLGSIEMIRSVDGQVIWTRAIDTDGLAGRFVVAGNLLVYQTESRPGNGRVEAVDAATGAQRWSRPDQPQLRGSMMADSARLYGVEANRLVARSSQDGSRQWDALVPGVRSSPFDDRTISPTLHQGKVVVFAGNLLTSFDAAGGSQIYSQTVTGCTAAGFGWLTVDPEGDLFLLTSDCAARLDPATGAVIWVRTGSFVPETLPAADRSSFYIIELDNGVRLTALSQQNGSVVWSQPLPNLALGDVQGNLLVGLDHVFVPSRDAGLLSYDLHDREFDWHHPMTGSLAFTTDRGLLIAGNENIAVVELDAAPDGDSDGMPNYWERWFGLNLSLATDATGDIDGDGLNNLDEFMHQTGPRQIDSDADGLRDGDEVHRYGTRPGLADFDGDGLSDGDEAMNRRTNPVRRDTDGDGSSDGEELGEYATNPLSAASRPTRIEYVHESFENGMPGSWETVPGTNGGWSVDRNESLHGPSSLRSAAGGSSVRSTMRWTADFVAGQFSFATRVTPPRCCGALTVWLDDRVVALVGKNSWQTYSFDVPAGRHSITFDFLGTSFGSNPAAVAYLDDVRFRRAAPSGSRPGGFSAGSAGYLQEFGEDGRLRLAARSISSPSKVTTNVTAAIASFGEGQLAIAAASYVGFYDSLNGTTRHRQVASGGSDIQSMVVTPSAILINESRFNGFLQLDREGRYRRRTGTAEFVYDLTFGLDGFVYALVGFEGQVEKFDGTTLQRIWSRRFDCALCSDIAVDALGNVSFSNRIGELVQFASDGTSLRKVRVPGFHVKDLALLPSGRLAFGTFLGGVGLVDPGEVTARILPSTSEFVKSAKVATLSRSGRDTDGDGLPDWWEHHYGLRYDFDDRAVDLDGDGLTNQVEFQRGTHADIADSDGDGISDGQEVLTYLSDPLHEDTDDDRLRDGQELTSGTNLLQADSDRDGLSDGEELAWHSDPLRADSDGDGLNDGWERRNGFDLASANDATTDLDGDGLSQLEEYRLGLNPRNRDTDGDGIDDGQESRQTGANPQSSDSDGDGADDGWEIRNGYQPGVADSAGDTDGDGFSNLVEYFAESDPKAALSQPRAKPWSAYQGDELHRGYVPVRILKGDVRALWSQTLQNGPGELKGVASVGGMAFAVVLQRGTTSSLKAIRGTDGTSMWERRLRETFSVSAPGVSEGRVFVQSQGVKSLDAFAAADGRPLFRGEVSSEFGDLLAPTAVGGDVFTVEGRDGVAALDATNGRRRWRADIDSGNGFAPLVLKDEIALYAHDWRGNFTGLDRRTGALKFNVLDENYVRVGNEIRGAPVLGRRQDMIATYWDGLRSFDLSRRSLNWIVPVDAQAQPAWANGVIYVGREDALAALDAISGREIWRWQSPNIVTGPSIVTLTHVIVPTYFKTFFIDLATRQAVLELPVSGRMALGEDGVLYISSQRTGVLHAFTTLSDQDADGMPDGWEREYNLNPNSASDAVDDDDRDGLNNLAEYRVGSRPRSADTDEDGLQDGDEVNNRRTSPIRADSDEDSLSDGDEISVRGTNPLKRDTDDDGLLDAYELSQSRSDPRRPDSDGDRFNDGWEVDRSSDPNKDTSVPTSVGTLVESFEQPLSARWSTGSGDSDEWFQSSTRTDGAFGMSSPSLEPGKAAAIEFTERFDEVEVTFDFNVQSPNPDVHYGLRVDGVVVKNFTDGGWASHSIKLDTGIHTLHWEISVGLNAAVYSHAAALDNVRIALQDEDRDGLPDGWERTYGLNKSDSSDASGDADGDGLANKDEYLARTRPDRSDTDEDGMRDGWEVTYSLDPLRNDASEDADGDGATNKAEFDASTHPRNRDSVPPSIAPPSAGPPPPTASPKSSGGGGAIGEEFLLLIFVLIFIRVRRALLTL